MMSSESHINTALRNGKATYKEVQKALSVVNGVEHLAPSEVHGPCILTVPTDNPFIGVRHIRVERSPLNHTVYPLLPYRNWEVQKKDLFIWDWYNLIHQLLTCYFAGIPLIHRFIP